MRNQRRRTIGVASKHGTLKSIPTPGNLVPHRLPRLGHPTPTHHHDPAHPQQTQRARLGHDGVANVIHLAVVGRSRHRVPRVGRVGFGEGKSDVVVVGYRAVNLAEVDRPVRGDVDRVVRAGRPLGCSPGILPDLLVAEKDWLNRPL